MNFTYLPPISPQIQPLTNFDCNLLRSSSEKVSRAPVFTPAWVISPPFSLCLPNLALLFVVCPQASFIWWSCSMCCYLLEDKILVLSTSEVLVRV
ncbi:hypothetical protein C1H46_034231 [Malus baccata]|uniref:Uncharacterized protein n=1 Tax=Malus baccata TaxID=106549 RepID=A0A540L1L9_MALBA|nr:hypothetical protein C1H46_034231 [Malus baccata]